MSLSGKLVNSGVISRPELSMPMPMPMSIDEDPKRMPRTWKTPQTGKMVSYRTQESDDQPL